MCMYRIQMRKRVLVCVYVFVCARVRQNGLFSVRTRYTHTHTHTERAFRKRRRCFSRKNRHRSLRRSPPWTDRIGVRKFGGGNAARRIGNSGARAFSERATLGPE